MKRLTAVAVSLALVGALASTAATAAPRVSGSTISWPDDGWYQVLSADDYSEICGGGSSCDVSAGRYIVINHTTGQRFENVVVRDSSGAPMPVTVSGSTISWPDDGWYQVQRADDYSTVCEGVRQCDVDDGVYTVINHTSGMRFPGILVDASDSGPSPEEPSEPTDPSSPTGPDANGITVLGNTISWPDDGWYQVQSLETFESICEGGQSCVVPDGVYVIINHTRGERFEPYIITGASSGAFTQLGVVGINYYSSDQRIELFGTFYNLAGNETADALRSNFGGDADTCEVSVTELSAIPETDFVQVTNNVSAGDVITIGSPAGSFAEMSRQTSEDFIFYRSADTIAGPLPSGLVLDIPGDAFPAFSSIQVPDVQPIALISPTIGESIGAESVFTWEAGSNSNAFVNLSMRQIDGSEMLTSVDCYVTDDGNFAFPASTKAELGSDFSTNGAGISRSENTFHQQGNAFLVVTRQSAHQ